MSGVESLVKVVEIQGRGRSLVASQPLRGGQIVLKDSPILVYSAFPLINQRDPNSNFYCDNCFRTLPTPPQPHSSCCNQHIFCSRKCQTAAPSPWLCQSLNRLQECHWQQIDQPLERQVEARFLIHAYNLALVSPSSFQILLSLHGQHSDSDTAAAQFLHFLLSSICPPPSPIQGFSVELTAALLAKDNLNAFSFMEPFSQGKQGGARAYAIYPHASFFNHDCLPNACRFDYLDSDSDNNTDIIVRMIHDVPEGREICLSYFPVNQNYSCRQKRLLEIYGFTCDCDRCKVEANWSDSDDNGNENEKENENVNEELMDEDYDEEMVAAVGASDIENEGENQTQNDFPHQYFFLNYMCNRGNCCGTLAPLPPSDATPSNVMECNVCGSLKNYEDMDD